MSKSQLTLCSLPMFSMDAAMHYPNLAGIFAMDGAGNCVSDDIGLGARKRQSPLRSRSFLIANFG